MAGMAEAEIQSWVDKANEVLGASNTPEVAQQKAAETHEAYSTELVNSSPEVTQAAETLPESANQALESADTTTAATGMGVETGDAAAASYEMCIRDRPMRRRMKMQGRSLKKRRRKPGLPNSSGLCALQ